MSIIALVVAAPMMVQQACFPRSVVVDGLRQRYDEQVIMRGFTESGLYMIEVFVSPSGTFTVMRTSTRGVSCVIGSGVDFERVEALEGDPS